MKFRPLYDRALLRRVEEQTKTAGGILIPDTAQEKPAEAEVVAVGPGTRKKGGGFVPMDLKVGDRVLLGKWAGTEVKIDDEDYLIVTAGDVLGVLLHDNIAAQAA